MVCARGTKHTDDELRCAVRHSLALPTISASFAFAPRTSIAHLIDGMHVCTYSVSSGNPTVIRRKTTGWKRRVAVHDGVRKDSQGQVEKGDSEARVKSSTTRQMLPEQFLA